MKGRAFTLLGGLLILSSLCFSYVEFGRALQGSAGAWMMMSALICAGVLGVGMVKVGLGWNPNDPSRSSAAIGGAHAFPRNDLEGALERGLRK